MTSERQSGDHWVRFLFAFYIPGGLLCVCCSIGDFLGYLSFDIYLFITFSLFGALLHLKFKHSLRTVQFRKRTLKNTGIFIIHSFIRIVSSGEMKIMSHVKLNNVKIYVLT